MSDDKKGDSYSVEVIHPDDAGHMHRSLKERQVSMIAMPYHSITPPFFPILEGSAMHYLVDLEKNRALSLEHVYGLEEGILVMHYSDPNTKRASGYIGQSVNTMVRTAPKPKKLSRKISDHIKKGDGFKPAQPNPKTGGTQFAKTSTSFRGCQMNTLTRRQFKLLVAQVSRSRANAYDRTAQELEHEDFKIRHLVDSFLEILGAYYPHSDPPSQDLMLCPAVRHFEIFAHRTTPSHWYECVIFVLTPADIMPCLKPDTDS
ncbi:hypothetical protein DFH07DRAFT_766135 [Mycena maculata]|uniref:Uncharacterized protein n=1 Tax=Mycena maculata TaxID=230809 RepID=A0AAD7NWG9_9AGAR|nr:hypothetical protein DFH07DRAFT_766135 [Mycena maculata]